MHFQRIILQGGEDVKKRTNEKLMESICHLSNLKRILIIPWTAESPEKELEYRIIFKNYFIEVGFNDILFLEKTDQETDIDKKFALVDVVYLPGGDPVILYNQIRMRNIDHKIRNFKGTIVGNSAGAIVLSKGSIIEGKFIPGFALVNFYVFVHFKLQESMDLDPNIGIQEDGWVCVIKNLENFC